MKQGRIWHYFQTQHPESFSGAATRLFHLARKLPAASTVLNIGVGSGQFDALASGLGHEVISLDPDTASLARACGGRNAVTGLIQAIPLRDSCVDVVVVSEVLEHLDDDTLDRGLDEIRRVLKDDGLILGTVPYKEDLDQSMVVCPDCGKVFHKVGHVRSFDIPAIHATLENRFRDLHVYRQAFMNTTDLGLPRRLLAWIRNQLVAISLLTRDQTLVFTGRKRPFGK
ncbi:class I SAM-dependent methyltransferase [Vulcaniibacterium gelatinicum]|uniref:class I SAM-dependent methyltransferase n=1 Tax=Vulcaniibacterium gelatinicum TaxID=2598725 RepID=UPI0015F2B39B|nr:methyltransferase domain-containing protein [Vulcaniibacterium gelatinicum]